MKWGMSWAIAFTKWWEKAPRSAPAWDLETAFKAGWQAALAHKRAEQASLKSKRLG